MGRSWSLTLDHRVPGDDREFVVAVWWVNYMKTDLGEDELWVVVRERQEWGVGYRPILLINTGTHFGLEPKLYYLDEP